MHIKNYTNYFTVQKNGDLLVKNSDQAVKRYGLISGLFNYLFGKDAILCTKGFSIKFISKTSLQSLKQKNASSPSFELIKTEEDWVKFFAGFKSQPPIPLTQPKSTDQPSAPSESEEGKHKPDMDQMIENPTHPEQQPLSSTTQTQGPAQVENTVNMTTPETVPTSTPAQAQKEVDEFNSIKKNADEGDAAAQLYIGKWYLYSWPPVKQDFVSAFHYFKEAADKGQSEAQWYTAECYKKALGTHKNTELAFKYYEMSGKQMFPRAQYEIAMCYLNGIVVNKNPEEGFFRLTVASFNGDSKAKLALADCYLNGIGTEKNEKEAFELLKELADQPSYEQAEAARKVGTLYRDGIGVDRNPEEAEKYLKQDSLFEVPKAKDAQ